MRWFSASLLGVVLVSGGVRQMEGHAVRYDNEDGFRTAAPPLTMESFESLAATEPSLEDIVTPHFVVSIQPLEGSTADMYIGEGGQPNGLHATDGQKYLAAGDQPSPLESALQLTFDLDNPVVAFGLNVIDYGDKPHDGQLTFENNVGDFFVIAEGRDWPEGNELFFGITNQDTAFSQVVITKTNYGDGIAVDKILFGIPEPCTLALLAMGAVAVLACALRKRRR